VLEPCRSEGSARDLPFGLVLGEIFERRRGCRTRLRKRDQKFDNSKYFSLYKRNPVPRGGLQYEVLATEVDVY
jgi:hypothetical protein